MCGRGSHFLKFYCSADGRASRGAERCVVNEMSPYTSSRVLASVLRPFTSEHFNTLLFCMTFPHDTGNCFIHLYTSISGEVMVYHRYTAWGCVEVLGYLFISHPLRSVLVRLLLSRIAPNPDTGNTRKSTTR